MTVLDVVRLVRHNALVILLCALLGVGGAAAWSFAQTEIYEGSSKGYLVTGSGGATTVNESLNANSLASMKVQQYLPLANTRAVHEHLAQELEKDGRGVAPGPFTVHNDKGTSILTVTARSTSPEAAQAIADAGVRAMAAEIRRLETLDTRKVQETGSLDDADSAGDASLTLVPYEPAALPSKPVSPDWRRNLLIGLGAGLLVAAVVMALRKAVDVRVRTTADVEELTGSFVLSVIPQSPDLAKQRKDASRLAPSGASAEALRQLRTNLQFVDVDHPPKSIVVTSSNPGEGKSTLAANLARALADTGQPVVLVDGDLRRPMVAKQFSVDGKIGVTQVLAGQVDLVDALQPTETHMLRVLPAGRIPPNPSELVGSQQMQDLIQRLAVHHVVLIDAPPLLPVTDAGLIAAHCDGAILVIRVGKTLKEQVRLSAKRLGQVHAKLLGTVLNMASKKAMGEVVYGYGYSSKDYTSDYYSTTERHEKEALGTSADEEPPTQPARSMAPAKASGGGRRRGRIQLVEGERDPD